jgi:selT/selW/selH-like putative selenoprotein
VDIQLQPGDAGAFEVFLGDRKVFSKLSQKRFPSYQEIPKLLLQP